MVYWFLIMKCCLDGSLGSPWRTMDASHRGYLLNKLADLIERDAVSRTIEYLYLCIILTLYCR